MARTPHLTALLNTGIINSSVVGDQWKRLQFPGDHILSLRKAMSSKSRPPLWRITTEPLANYPMMSRSVWVCPKKIFQDHLHTQKVSA